MWPQPLIQALIKSASQLFNFLYDKGHEHCQKLILNDLFFFVFFYCMFSIFNFFLLNGCCSSVRTQGRWWHYFNLQTMSGAGLLTMFLLYLTKFSSAKPTVIVWTKETQSKKDNWDLIINFFAYKRSIKGAGPGPGRGSVVVSGTRNHTN